MIVNEERKTSPKQRIIIVAIAVFMLFSTFALYVGIVLNYQNQESTTSDTNRKMARFNVLYEEYQKQKDAQGDELSGKYFDQFKKYKQNVKAFNAASANNLVKKDLVVGTGRALEYKTSADGKSYESTDVNYAAYYIGWLSDETIFDSSFDDNTNPTKLKSPLPGSTGMIQGWIEGLKVCVLVVSVSLRFRPLWAMATRIRAQFRPTRRSNSSLCLSRSHLQSKFPMNSKTSAWSSTDTLSANTSNNREDQLKSHSANRGGFFLTKCENNISYIDIFANL